jgi:hypothetical protein
MIIPKHSHSLVSIGDYVFSIGGSTYENNYSSTVERFNLNSKQWDYVSPLMFPWKNSKSCVSSTTNKIFVLGGCASINLNLVVEVYDCHLD